LVQHHPAPQHTLSTWLQNTAAAVSSWALTPKKSLDPWGWGKKALPFWDSQFTAVEALLVLPLCPLCPFCHLALELFHQKQLTNLQPNTWPLLYSKISPALYYNKEVGTHLIEDESGIIIKYGSATIIYLLEDGSLQSLSYMELQLNNYVY
jgi:hypothetical protein